MEDKGLKSPLLSQHTSSQPQAEPATSFWDKSYGIAETPSAPPLPTQSTVTATQSYTTYTPVQEPSPAWGVPAPGPVQPSALLIPAEQVVLCRHDHSQPGYVTCGNCGQVVVPAPHKEAGMCSWIIAAGLCFTGCWCCAWLPFCLDSTKDTVYHCPACLAEVYRIKLP